MWAVPAPRPRSRLRPVAHRDHRELAAGDQARSRRSPRHDDTLIGLCATSEGTKADLSNPASPSEFRSSLSRMIQSARFSRNAGRPGIGPAAIQCRSCLATLLLNQVTFRRLDFHALGFEKRDTLIQLVRLA